MTSHGQSKTRLYRIWQSMKGRCERPSCTGYPEYGGRGIKVCDEWHDFMTFHAWAHSHGYKDDLSIDRIDNGGDYCPENCRWATNYQQMQNRKVSLGLASKRNRQIPFHEFEALAKRAAENGIRKDTLRFRLTVSGWDDDAAVTVPPAIYAKTRLDYGGESHTLAEWSEITGEPLDVLKQRMRDGWTHGQVIGYEVRE